MKTADMERAVIDETRQLAAIARADAARAAEIISTFKAHSVPTASSPPLPSADASKGGAQQEETASQPVILDLDSAAVTEAVATAVAEQVAAAAAREEEALRCAAEKERRLEEMTRAHEALNERLRERERQHDGLQQGAQEMATRLKQEMAESAAVRADMNAAAEALEGIMFPL